MIRLYKDLTIGYILGVIAGVILAVVLILHDAEIFAIYLFEFLWIGIIRYLCNAAAIKRINKLIAIMNQECHAQEFLRQLVCLQENAKGEIMELFFATNLAAAYLNLGDADTALFHLQNINVDTTKRSRGKDKMFIVFYNNYAMAYMQKQDWEAAMDMLSKMKNLIDTVKAPLAVKQTYENYYRLKCIRIQAVQGNYEGAEEAFMNALEHTGSLLDQISLIYFLRDVFLYEGRWQEAEKCREFIRENGGDTYYVAKVG